MTGNGNEPDTTHASVGQFDDIDETILSMLEEDGRATLSQLSDATGLSIPRCNRACRNWNVVM